MCIWECFYTLCVKNVKCSFLVVTALISTNITQTFCTILSSAHLRVVFLSLWMLESHLQHKLSKLKHLSTALCEQACSFHSVRHIGRIADIPLLVWCLNVGTWPQKGFCSLSKLELLVFCSFVYLFREDNLDRIG